MTSLKNISQTLFSTEAPINEVEAAVQSYKSVVSSVSQSDINSEVHRNHLQLDNGIAIGLNWAATCLDDVIRTQKFIRGTKQAIDQKLSEGIRPVRLVYAGTGPFATLILPLLEHFTPEELQVTLIEINPESAANITRIFKQFEFEDHIEQIITKDATAVTLPNSRKWPDSTFDILLSETMQHALQAELQVPICSNLLHQMSENAILIPQSIQLDLTVFKMESSALVPTTNVGEFMTVDINFLRHHHPINSAWTFHKQFDVSILDIEPDSLLGIDTTIRVFGEEMLQRNESGLTAPKIMGPTKDFVVNGKITVQYAISPEPACSIQSSI